ncbi:hypothetical protein CHO01_23980 [Cellulomonas hominis]|uniref:Uncharacterized protein n=1 Tax=Cellulomonas hominis TaxID=156981 RepID=A0A511FDN2_9CELL|nr:hypothetical protein CHO01_23980 [Cellulomonas hominis]
MAAVGRGAGEEGRGAGVQAGGGRDAGSTVRHGFPFVPGRQKRPEASDVVPVPQVLPDPLSNNPGGPQLYDPGPRGVKPRGAGAA